MSMLGHNNGPTMEKGGAWRRYSWGRARAELLPRMPIEIVRRRVRRARELGIDYKAYAGIRAATGRDIVALLFSDNALRVLRDARIAPDRAAKLGRLGQIDLLSLVHPPLQPEQLVEANPIIVRADVAPDIRATWAQARQRIIDVKGKLPADGVVVVGETFLEKNWSEMGRLAGYIPASRYFG